MLPPSDLKLNSKVYTEQQAREMLENEAKLLPSFQVERDRQRFLIKVFSLLAIIMVITTGWVIHVHNREKVERWYQRGQWIVFASGICMLVMSVTLTTCFQLARKIPINAIFFTFFTFLHAVFCGSFVDTLRREEIMVSITVCAMAMFIRLALYSCFARTDLTMIGALFTTAFMMVICFIILNYALRISKTVLFVVTIIMPLLSTWVVHNTYLLISGKYIRFPFEVEDFIIAAIVVYVDLLTLPVYLLLLCSGPDEQPKETAK